MLLPEKKMAKVDRANARALSAGMDDPGKVPDLPRERYDHLDKIEWRGSVEELCAAILGLADVPEFNTGLASKNFGSIYPAWKRPLYLAARDFGIAQTTWSAILPGLKERACFSLTLNENGFLDEEAAEEIHYRVIDLISGH